MFITQDFLFGDKKMNTKIIGVLICMLVTSNVFLITDIVGANSTKSAETTKIEISPMNRYLGTYAEDDPKIVQGTFSVTNIGGGVLYLSIQDFPWWINDIVVEDGGRLSGECNSGETSNFTIFVDTSQLEAIAPNVNVYYGHINILSSSSNVNVTVKIGILQIPDTPDNFLEWILERFPNAFPILRQLIGL